MIFVIWYMDFIAELEIYRWLVCFFSAHAKIFRYLHNYIFKKKIHFLVFLAFSLM